MISDKIVNGVKFRFVRTPAYRNSSLLRIINMISYFLFLLIPAATKGETRPDVVVGSSVHPLAALAARILADRFEVPFIFEVRDLWPETLIAMGRVGQNGFQARVMRKLEQHLYRRAKKIVTLMPDASAYITAYGIEKSKIEWISNGVDTEVNVPVTSKNDKFTIMYLGAHGQANALETIVDSINILQVEKFSADIHFRFIGEGDRKKELIQRSRDYMLANVSFENGIPKKDIPRILAEADCLMLSVRDLPDLYRYGVSMNKIFDYMLAAKPIIIAMAAPYNPVLEAQAGICVPPESPDALAGAIKKITRMTRQELIRYGDRGRKYVEKYHSFSYLADKYARVLNDLAGEDRWATRP